MSTRWRKQKPPLGAQVNWAHPLARSLVFCCNPQIAATKDLVIGAAPTTAGVASYQSVGGGSIRTATNGDYVSYPLTIPADTPVTVFTLLQVDNIADGLRKRWVRLNNATNGTTFAAEVAVTTNRVDASMQYPAATFPITSGGASIPASKTPISHVLTWQPNALQSYINGKFDVEQTSGVTNSLVTDTITLGSNGTTLPLTGNLIMCAVWKRALSVDEIRQLYAEPYAFIQPPQPYRRFFGPTLASGVTGSASITQAENTVSAAGTVAITGAASITQAANTVSVAGTVDITATASITQADSIVSSTGTVAIVGSAAITQADGTVSSAGAVAIVGDSALTQAANTVSAIGAVAITGAASITQASNTVTAEATSGSIAEANITQAGNTLSAAGAVAITGAASLTQTGTVAAAGTVLISAAAAITQAANTVSAAGYSGDQLREIIVGTVVSLNPTRSVLSLDPVRTVRAIVP